MAAAAPISNIVYASTCTAISDLEGGADRVELLVSADQVRWKVLPFQNRTAAHRCHSLVQIQDAVALR